MIIVSKRGVKWII